MMSECSGEHDFKSFKKKTIKPQEGLGPGVKGPEKTTYEIRCRRCRISLREYRDE